MNITQRRYTLKRLEDLHKQKTLAILAENDLLVEAHNRHYSITYEEAIAIISTNPELIKLNKSNYNKQIGLNVYFDGTTARILLNKPTFMLDVVRDRNYLTSEQEELDTHTVAKTCFGTRVVLKEISERITKLNARITYAKDQVMLGDVQKALDALEEINSLVF